MIRSLLVTGALLGATGCGSSASSAPLVAPDAASSTAACAPRAASETEFVRSNDLGDLHGTLLVPEGCGPAPVVLFIAGSGATDRDSSPANTLKLLAEALAERGIASLRYDKAGVGLSRKAAPARESDMRFDGYAHDAAVLVRALREDSRFDRVFVIGHSEGSLLGLVAARETPIDGFVSLAGAGRPIAEVLREQLAQNISDASLLTTANHIIDELLAGRTVDDVPSSLSALFRPSVQPYLMSWFAIDPATLMHAFEPRALIVQGTTDLQVKLVDAERLHDAKPDSELFVVEGMNHTLKTATGNAAAQKKAYTDGAMPLAAELVPRIADFITR